MSVTRRYGSVAKAKAASKGGGPGSDIIQRLKADSTVKVRFLQNPEDWHGVYSHYLPERPQWCSKGDDKDGKCVLCDDGKSRSRYALANVLLVKENKVVVFQMPGSLADKVLKHYSRNDDTVLDRDYDLVREGSGKTDTRYDAYTDSPKRRDLSRYALHDIEDVISADISEEVSSEEEDDEPRSSKFQRIREHDAKKKSRSRHEDEDEDLEEDEDEEPEDQYADLNRSELKAEIRKYDPDFTAKKSQSDEDLLEILRDLASEEEDEDEEDDEDDEEEERPRKSSKKKRDSGLDEFRPGKSKNPSSSAKRVVRRAR